MLSKPSSRETLHELTALITRLLQHYWTATEPIGARRTQIEDWIEDLREFRLATVEDACREWRRLPDPRRPLPGDIRRLCLERISTIAITAQPDPHRAERNEARRRHGEDMRREGRDLMNRWALTKGFADVDAYAADRGIHWSAAYREHLAETLNRSTIIGRTPAPAIGDVARGLGVTATEFNPTPEQMAASRRDLGIDTAATIERKQTHV
jgi:hypothetical protein